MRKQGQPHRAQDFEMNFDKFVASLYMTSLMQLGLAAPQGAKPEVDLIGARQTIDTLGHAAGENQGQSDAGGREHAAERVSTSCAWPTWK